MTDIADRVLPPAGREGGRPARNTGLIVAAVVAVTGLMLAALSLVQMARPLPASKVRLVAGVSRTLPGSLALPWPSAGQPFTEREALEALLIVSANNIAHELARWDSGGDAAFTAEMNATAHALGMTGSHYTDPSGFDATTVSTASDQVILFRAAMRLPAFAEVVSKSSYTPRAGGETRAGGNTLLGSYGVVGGKTGFTSQAGANYVFAARTHGRLLVGAIMSQPGATSPATAVNAAQPLILAAENALTTVTLARAGTPIAG